MRVRVYFWMLMVVAVATLILAGCGKGGGY
jgi:hypothetical protein